MEYLKERTEFYKSLYEKEHERSKFFDNSIRFPATLIIIYIGGAFYSFNNYFQSDLTLESFLDWIFLIVFAIFCISTLITMYFLAITFHGFTRKYEYLPFTSKLKSHEVELYKYHYKYSNIKKSKERRLDAQSKTYDAFLKNIENYFITLTERNQIINDKRADNYYLTRSFLFVNLILLVILGSIEFTT